MAYSLASGSTPFHMFSMNRKTVTRLITAAAWIAIIAIAYATLKRLPT